ncbi:MAG: Glycosyltransferase, group 1 family protein [Parcubacteria group bacterium GW2011_GWE2_38_18]|nr:MAG: Glycosyltransferase, group 1 family protein [Parcubacteria group bacterium GW2011_GWE2_38_18]
MRSLILSGPAFWLIKILRPEVPIISTFHTRCYIHKKWGFFARLYLKFGEFMACTFADVTTTVSKSLTSYAKEKYHAQAVYIPNGVSLPEKLPTKEIKKWGLEKGNYIVAVSRLVRHKGVHYLIDAYKQLTTEKKLVIVGDGSFTEDYVQELKQMVGDNKNIIFTGSQSGEILNELFSNAYLFVQPSESEGLSIALLEAMSYENAVLISDIPENLEAAEDVGFSFKDRDVDDLKEKLSYLLKNPELVEVNGRMGRDRVDTHYSWKNISKDIVAVYNKVIIEKKATVSSRFNLVKKFTSLF